MACASLRSRRLNRFLTALVWVVGALALVGCAPEQLTPVGSKQEEPLDATQVRISVDALGSHLRIHSGDTIVGIGQLDETVFRGDFAKPPKATNLTELPPGFDESFSTSGWETFKRNLAGVFKDGRLVLLLDNQDQTAAGEAEGQEAKYERIYGLPTTTASSGSTRYKFWEDGPVRLMTVVSSGADGESFVVALGLVSVMDRLRMDPDSARIDALKADEVLKEGATTAGAQASL